MTTEEKQLIFKQLTDIEERLDDLKTEIMFIEHKIMSVKNIVFKSELEDLENE